MIVFTQTFAITDPNTIDLNGLYDSYKYDNGNYTLQTCRRPEILKLWLLWKVHGTSGIGSHVEYCANLGKYFVSQLASKGMTFHILSFMDGVQSPRVAFYYVPHSLRSFPRDMDYSNMKLHNFTKKLQEILLQNGGIYMGYRPGQGLQVEE